MKEIIEEWKAEAPEDKTAILASILVKAQEGNVEDAKAEFEQAKAEYNQSMAQKLNLDYLNDVNGIKHNQDLELMSQQAKAQADKSMQEKYMDYLIEKEKTKQQLNKRKDKK